MKAILELFRVLVFHCKVRQIGPRIKCYIINHTCGWGGAWVGELTWGLIKRVPYIGRPRGKEKNRTSLHGKGYPSPRGPLISRHIPLIAFSSAAAARSRRAFTSETCRDARRLGAGLPKTPNAQGWSESGIRKSVRHVQSKSC